MDQQGYTSAPNELALPSAGPRHGHAPRGRSTRPKAGVPANPTRPPRTARGRSPPPGSTRCSCSGLTADARESAWIASSREDTRNGRTLVREARHSSLIRRACSLWSVARRPSSSEAAGSLPVWIAPESTPPSVAARSLPGGGARVHRTTAAGGRLRLSASAWPRSLPEAPWRSHRRPKPRSSSCSRSSRSGDVGPSGRTGVPGLELGARPTDRFRMPLVLPARPKLPMCSTPGAVAPSSLGDSREGGPHPAGRFAVEHRGHLAPRRKSTEGFPRLSEGRPRLLRRRIQGGFSGGTARIRTGE